MLLRTMELRKPTSRAPRHAFTLMEMLVVVAIIVVLAGMGGYFFMNQLDTSKIKLARNHCKTTLSMAVETYKIDQGVYPPSLESLLVRTETGNGPYLKTTEALFDPWKNKYEYNAAGPRNNGIQPDIWTVNPADGTLIGNWPD